MKFLVEVRMCVQTFNAAVLDGSAGPKLQRIMEEIKPEVAYFVERDGVRTGTFIVEMKEASELPKFAEPFFLMFNAEVRCHPAMSPEDLMKADLAAIAKKWS